MLDGGLGHLAGGRDLQFWEQMSGGAGARLRADEIPGFAIGAWLDVEVTATVGAAGAASLVVRLGPPGQAKTVLDAKAVYPVSGPGTERLGVSFATSGATFHGSYDRDIIDLSP